MLTEYIVMAIVAAVLGGYIITSLVLFRYPAILHKKKNLKFRPKHISHRGGAGENIENTMTAFHHAVSLGTEMLELDCHISKDGQVVVSHDNSLKRTCSVDATIADFNYKDLPQLNETQRLDFTPSFTFSGGHDRRMPLLKEVFDEFPTIPINVDIKIDNDELIEKVHNLIVEYKRESLTAWGNRSSVVTDKLYKLNPDIPLFFNMRKVVLIVLYMYCGLLPFLPLKESCFEVVMPSIIKGSLKNKNGDIPLIFSAQRVLYLVFAFYSGLLPFLPIKESLFEILLPSTLLGNGMNLTRGQRFLIKAVDVLLMRPALFSHLEKRGIQSYLWVLNKEEDFERAFKIGSTGVMTDFPTMLSEYLAKNNSDFQGNIDQKPKGYQSINSS